MGKALTARTNRVAWLVGRDQRSGCGDFVSPARLTGRPDARRLAARIACLAAGLALTAPSVGADDGVRIGGSVTIKSSTGEITNRAVGEGAKAARCAGAITGSDVEIQGDVDIEHTGSAQGCACVGDGCDTADAANSDPQTKEDGDSTR